jgi:aspartate-semialdehyde dehydrogenase
VGQRFISLIGDTHPQFTIHALGASPRSAGKPYIEAVNWKLADDIPSVVSNLTIQICEPKGPFLECDVVFSGLDSDVAGDIGNFLVRFFEDAYLLRNGFFES